MENTISDGEIKDMSRVKKPKKRILQSGPRIQEMPTLEKKAHIVLSFWISAMIPPCLTRYDLRHSATIELSDALKPIGLASLLCSNYVQSVGNAIDESDSVYTQGIKNNNSHFKSRQASSM